MMEDEEILENIGQHASHFVVLTGGEPSLFVDNHFVDLLHSHDYYVAIETNGTRLLPRTIDWITLSPKIDVENGNELMILEADELKIVYHGQDLDGLANISAKHRFIQPCDFNNADKNAKNLHLCIDYCKTHPEWKLSVQLHKLIGIK